MEGKLCHYFFAKMSLLTISCFDSKQTYAASKNSKLMATFHVILGNLSSLSENITWAYHILVIKKRDAPEQQA